MSGEGRASRWLASGAAVACLLTVAAGAAPTTALGAGPGLPNLSYEPAQLFETLALIEQEQGMVAAALHRGYLFVPFAAGGPQPEGGFSFWDVSDPFLPQEVVRVQDSESEELRQPQGFAFLRRGEDFWVALQAQRGIQIWEVTDPLQPLRSTYLDLGVNGTNATGVWWIGARGAVLFAGAQDDGVFVVDAADPEAPEVVAHRSVAELGGVSAGGVHPVGDLLLVGAALNRHGYALLDVSAPSAPVLLAADASERVPFNHGTNYDGRLILGAGSDDALHLHRASPAGGFVELSSLPTGGKGGFVTIQDRFVHFGASDLYQKIRVSDPSAPMIVGEAIPPVPAADWDQATPLGNLLLVASDEPGAAALVVHQLAPDARGPRVVAVSPRNGSVDEPATTAVGVSFSDWIDLSSVDATTFLLRPSSGGSPLDGTYSASQGVINFSPASPLVPGTTYELRLPAGGLTDYAGNPLPAPFVSRFTTASD